jgi:hypothetical protein
MHQHDFSQGPFCVRCGDSIWSVTCQHEEYPGDKARFCRLCGRNLEDDDHTIPGENDDRFAGVEGCPCGADIGKHNEHVARELWHAKAAILQLQIEKNRDKETLFHFPDGLSLNQTISEIVNHYPDDPYAMYLTQSLAELIPVSEITNYRGVLQMVEAVVTRAMEDGYVWFEHGSNGETILNWNDAKTVLQRDLVLSVESNHEH